MKKAALLAFFVSLPLIAAETPAVIPEYSKIHDAYGTQACEKQETANDMDLCSERELANSKKALSVRYKSVLSTLNSEYPETAKQLRVAQKMWEKFYPISCKIRKHESESGSGYNSIINFCLIEMINERISYLNTLTD